VSTRPTQAHDRNGDPIADFGVRLNVVFDD
jgi:hypothetical protein